MYYERDDRGVERLFTPTGEIKQIKSNGVSGAVSFSKTFDKSGNVIKYQESDFNYIKEYNDRGQVIHYKDSKDDEWWREYDNQGTMIHSKDNKGKESWQLVEGLLTKKNNNYYLNGKLCVE